jgi:hypothetical protein
MTDVVCAAARAERTVRPRRMPPLQAVAAGGAPSTLRPPPSPDTQTDRGSLGVEVPSFRLGLSRPMPRCRSRGIGAVYTLRWTGREMERAMRFELTTLTLAT